LNIIQKINKFISSFLNSDRSITNILNLNKKQYNAMGKKKLSLLFGNLTIAYSNSI
jgi:hypothetical protein